MGTEIEYKFRLADAAPYRARLTALGAAFIERVRQLDRMLDAADRRLLAAGCGLRVRETWVLPAAAETTSAAAPNGPHASRGTACVTFKGPRQAGPLKTREELETPVDDGATLRTVFARLGFEEVIRYEKRREVWHLNPCVVTLDELPDLGWWLEIEGPAPAAVEHVRSQLGLAQVAPAPETYVELAAQHGRSVEDGRRVLTFACP